MDAALKAKLSFYRYRLIEHGYEVATEDEQTNLAKAFKVPLENLYPASEAVSA
jgi:hypothetical protein